MQTVRNLQIRRNLPLVHGIALEHVVLQDLIRPATESYATLCIDAKPYGDYHI